VRFHPDLQIKDYQNAIEMLVQEIESLNETIRQKNNSLLRVSIILSCHINEARNLGQPIHGSKVCKHGFREEFPCPFCDPLISKTPMI